MSNVGNLNINININTTGLNQAQNSIRSFADGVRNTLSNALSVTLGNLASSAIKSIGSALKDVTVAGVEYNAQIEQLVTNYEVLTGSQEKAVSLMKEIQDFANVTPFETKDIAGGVDVLLGYGVGVEKVMAITSMLGDVSKGNAEKFKSMSLAFGQAFANGKLQGQDLLQMINAGFNPLQEMSSITGKSVAQLRKEMEQGKIGVDLMMKAYIKATSEGGRFNGMMEKQSKTYNGLLSTLKDKFSMTLGAATEGLTEKLKSAMSTSINILDNLLTPESINTFKAKIDENIIPAVEKLGKTILVSLGVTDELGDISNFFEDLTQKIAHVIDSLTFMYNVIRNAFLIMKMLVAGLVLGLSSIAIAIAYIVEGLLIFLATLGVVFGVMVLSIAGVIEGLARGLDGIFSLIATSVINLAKGIINGLTWGAKESLNALVNYLLNPFIDKYNQTIGSLSGHKLERAGLFDTNSKVFEYSSFAGDLDKITGAFGKNNASFRDIQPTIDGYKDVIKQFSDFNKSVVDPALGLTNKMGDSITSSLESLLSPLDPLSADAFLNKLGKATPSANKYGDDAKNKLLDGLGSADGDGKGTKSLKSASDGIKDITDSLKKATESIFKFGDAFEKVTFEKFSPAKLMSRTTKIFDAMKSWVNNMLQLSKLGVSEEVLNEFRGMGLKSAGMVQGLLKADPSARSKILANIGGTSSLAQLQGGMTVRHEHGGVIQVKGDNGQIQLVNVADIVGKEISANRNRYSSVSSPINTFK